MKVYDCFLFFNELDLLEIRLNELDSVIDYFVLIEAERTHQNNPKPLYFANAIHEERFAKFRHKIIHYVAPSSNFNSNNPHGNEIIHRRLLTYPISFVDDDDILIISDVDEIPRASTISTIVSKNIIPSVIIQNTHYYYLNTWMNTEESRRWYGPVIFNKKVANNLFEDPELTRSPSVMESIYQVVDNSWHFSFLGDAKNAHNKMSAFSEASWAHLSQEFVESAYSELKDPLGRPGVMVEAYDDLSSLPEYVQNNLDKYSRYIYFKQEKSIHSL